VHAAPAQGREARVDRLEVGLVGARRKADLDAPARAAAADVVEDELRQVGRQRTAPVEATDPRMDQGRRAHVPEPSAQTLRSLVARMRCS